MPSDEDRAEEASAAAYAAGVEHTEARAVRRITELEAELATAKATVESQDWNIKRNAELEAKVKEYEFRWAKMQERIKYLEGEKQAWYKDGTDWMEIANAATRERDEAVAELSANNDSLAGTIAVAERLKKERDDARKEAARWEDLAHRNQIEAGKYLAELEKRNGRDDIGGEWDTL